MRKLKVEILNNTTLKLLEDGFKGDLIDLEQITTVNTEIILNKIKEETDLVYKNLLTEQEKVLRRELELEKTNLSITLTNEINDLKKDLLNKEQEVKNQLLAIHQEELNQLKNTLTISETNYQNLIKSQSEQLLNKEKEVKSTLLMEYERELNNLKNEINNLKFANEIQITNEKSKIDNLKNEYQNNLMKINLKNEQSINKLVREKEEELRSLNLELDNLKRERSNLNVKEIGEDLEQWAFNKFNENHLVQPDNIKWYKDNVAVKGGKADFIYEVYGRKEELKDILLTSVILEMKSEDPHAPTKQRLDTILKKLDSDRNNKNIEYAVLVSEINYNNNDLHIERIKEYPNMFIVRPQYFMTLLNVITAFALKYEELLAQDVREAIEFKDSTLLLEEFASMKNDMLDNQIKHINNHLDTIKKQNQAIINSANKINESLEIIIESHLKALINKIENFNINKISKRISEISNK